MTYIQSVYREEAPPLPEGLSRFARFSAYARGVVAAIGLILSAIFFTVGGVSGPLNDLAVIVQCILMLPIAYTVHRMLAPRTPSTTLPISLDEVAGMLVVILLQASLVLGILPFRRQMVLAIPVFLVAAGWFAAITPLGRGDGRLPQGLWAFSPARRWPTHAAQAVSESEAAA